MVCVYRILLGVLATNICLLGIALEVLKDLV